MTAAPGSFTAANGWTIVAASCLALLIAGVVMTPRVRPADGALRAAILEESVQSTLFVHGDGETWYQPLAVYPSRWLIRAGVPQELAIRLPSMVAGLLTIVLAYVVAVQLSGDVMLGALTTLLLVAMPGFRGASQAAGGELWTVAFVLAWFVAILSWIEHPRTWVPFVGGAALAASIYGEPEGVWSVPIFFALGVILLRAERRARSAIWRSAIGIAVVAAPAVGWVITHREAYADTFGRWAIHAAHIRSPGDGVVAFTQWAVMARRVEEYWQYFNPTFLFGREMLGLPLLALVPLGVWAVGKRWSQTGRLLVVGGSLLAPVPAVLLDAPRQAALASLLLPLAAVSGAAAIPVIAAMRRGRSAVMTAMVVLLLLTLTLAAK
jgi:hypothetical protein